MKEICWDSTLAHFSVQWHQVTHNRSTQKHTKHCFLFLRMKFACFAKVAIIQCSKLIGIWMHFAYLEKVAIIKYSKLIGIWMKFGYFAKVAIIKYLKFVGPLCAKTLKNLTCSHTSNHQHAIQRSYIGLDTRFCLHNIVKQSNSSELCFWLSWLFCCLNIAILWVSTFSK